MKEDTRGLQDQTYYLVRVKADSAHLVGRNGEEMAVTPGMTATVEILTGKKTILNYLIKPIVKTLHESMTER
jgi:adhesin transport system membrane fusion protein